MNAFNQNRLLLQPNAALAALCAVPFVASIALLAGLDAVLPVKIIVIGFMALFGLWTLKQYGLLPFFGHPVCIHFGPTYCAISQGTTPKRSIDHMTTHSIGAHYIVLTLENRSDQYERTLFVTKWNTQDKDAFRALKLYAQFNLFDTKPISL